MKFIKGVLWGIVWGLGFTAAIFVLAMALDLVGCFFTCGSMACFSYDSCSSHVWSDIWDGFDGVLILGIPCGLIGAVIGSIYGIVKQSQANSEAQERRQREAADSIKWMEEQARAKKQAEEAAKCKQRKDYAAEFKRQFNDVVRQCENYAKESEKINLHPIYEAATLQESLWDAINNVSLPLQKLDDSIADPREKGGRVK